MPNLVLSFIEERAYDLYSYAHEEAERWKREMPSTFKNVDERNAYNLEIYRLLKLAYYYLDQSDIYSSINRKIGS
jgi:hypothetical protein